ncbi:MAG: DUF1192 domain-containing protein [Hyphomicrobiaceae bacterium]
MDWDDAQAKGKAEISLGEALGRMSIAELEARVAALEAEIARTKSEISAKKSHSAAANSIFKS